MGFFTRKPLESFERRGGVETTGPNLLPALGPFSLIALGIGAIVGSGIFVITGVVASLYAGPAVTLSLVIAGIGCVLSALCYAELASMIPVAGSAYSYAYATLGRGVAWIIGWSLILEYLFAASSVAVGWSGYLVSTLHGVGIDLPAAFVAAPLGTLDGTHLVSTGAVINLPAVLLVAVLSILVAAGVRQSAAVINVMVVIKLLVVTTFILAGLGYVHPENWVPFIPPNTGAVGHFGWTGVMRGAGVIFVAYLGFDAVSTASQEARNPRRDVPLAILGSLGICTVLYIAVGSILTGLVSYRALNVPNPMAVAIAQQGPSLAWLSPVVNLGAIVGLTSVALVLIYAQPRIFLAMASDGLLPPIFGRIDARLQTPTFGIAVTGAASALLAGFLPIGLLAEMDSIGTLLAFIVVCSGVLVLRRVSPAAVRRFRVPFSPLLPTLGVILCAYMMLGLSGGTWLRLVLWLGIGLVVYWRRRGAEVAS